MTRPEVWQAAWDEPDPKERLRIVLSWERESGCIFYESEPSRERRLHRLAKAAGVE